MQHKEEGKHTINDIDESALSFEARLGLAWCRLNCYEWDDFIGEKPLLFDDLPMYEPERFFRFGAKKPSKHTYVFRTMKAIENIIGEPATSRYWWEFELGKDSASWIRWYIENQENARTRNRERCGNYLLAILAVVLSIAAWLR